MNTDKEKFINKIHIHDNWIVVDGIGRIGMYWKFDKKITLDYSLKLMGYSNEEIYCNESEIKEKIYKLFTMKTIKTFYGREPILMTRYNEQQKATFGLHRDRYPDSGWDEFRWTRMEDEKVKETELTDSIKQILIEDICECYKGKEAYDKLKEFDLIK
jgi:hypothetical protein